MTKLTNSFTVNPSTPSFFITTDVTPSTSFFFSTTDVTPSTPFFFNTTDVTPSNPSFYNATDVTPFNPSFYNTTDVTPSTPSFLSTTDVTPSITYHNKLSSNTADATTFSFANKTTSPQMFHPKCISFMFLNARSINCNFNKIELFLNKLNFRPTIISIAETWLNTNNQLLHRLHGYTFIDMNTTGRCGGVGMFIRTEMSFETVKSFNLNDASTDELWIRLILPNGKKLIVASIYRRPDQNFTIFQSKFLTSLDILSNNNSLYLIGGDFNIDLSSKARNINNYKCSFTSYGCNQLISSCTRFAPGNKPSLLDHIYSNICNNNIVGQTIISDFSDHFATTAFVNINLKISHSSRKVVKRDFNNFNKTLFLADVSSSLHNINSLPSVNEQCNAFIDNIKLIVESNAPLKYTLFHKPKTPPWINKDINKLRVTKDKLFRKWLRKKTSLSRAIYVEARNKFSHAVVTSKNDFYSKLFYDRTMDSRTLWKNINKVINYKTSGRPQISSLKDNDDNIITNPNLISTMFNEYFVNIGENLAKTIPDSKTTFNSLINSPPCSLFLTPITPHEIKDLINSLNVNKANPSSSIPTTLLKTASPVICHFLSSLFNNCIVNGVFPDILKIAEVLPLHKSGCKMSCSNFRPISLLNILSKLFERCLHTRLYKFCTLNNILSRNQFGFRNKSSTENAVIKICDEIANSFNNKEFCLSIFLDLKKAFDTVNHDILLHKLYHYGVRGNAYSLFKSYLSNRYQYSLVNDVKSSLKLITCGVPQGSILGPLLFLLYINDISNVSTFNINLFADDSYLSLSDASVINLEKNVNAELGKIKMWLEHNKLSLNVKKTSFMVFTNRTYDHKFNIKFGSISLSQTSQVNYLGVILDEKMSWQQHIDKVQAKISSSVWAMSQVKNIVNKKALVAIYFGLVHSHLKYCISCWGGVCESKTAKLVTLQKRAIRSIFNVSMFTHSAPFFKRLLILNFHDMYRHQIAMIVCRHRANEWAGDLIMTPITSIHQHNTRFATNNYYAASPHNEVFKHGISFAGPVGWEAVPDHLKHYSPNQFKTKFRDHLLMSYI